MAASKKRPGAKTGRTLASTPKRTQAGSRSKLAHREQKAGEKFEAAEVLPAQSPMGQGMGQAMGQAMDQVMGQVFPTHVFPTQVMGWSRTAAQTEMPMVAMLTGADGASTHVAQAMVQSNVEVAALVGRRSRACLDFPAHLSKCQTPQQVLEQQSQFFREMLMDYHAANDRIIKAWFEFEPRS